MSSASSQCTMQIIGCNFQQGHGGDHANPRNRKSPLLLHWAFSKSLIYKENLAEWTGLEPATPGVTGRYSNQLNYHSW